MHRRSRQSLLSSVAAAAFLAISCNGVSATDTWTDIIPGVRHLHRVTTAQPWNIHALVVDVTNPRVRVGAIIKNESTGPDTGERVSSMAARHNALAAINGDYFSSGTVEDHIPQGMSVHDGYKIPISGHVSGRLSWAMDGSTLDSVLGVYSAYENWMYSVVSGGPRLLRAGVVSIENTAGLPSAGSLNPRTALGISQDKKTLILAVVDGRQTASRGMTGQEMAAFLLELGAWDALNFDSGGSSTFYLNGAVRNVPSDGAERRVANAIAVWDRADQGPNPSVPLWTGFETPPFVQGPINGQNGWVGTGVTKVVGSQAQSGSQSLELDQGSADKSFTTTTDPVQWIDFWAKRQTAQGWGMCYFGAAPSSNIFGIVGYLNGGNLNYWDGNKVGGGVWKVLRSYTLGQWQRISIRADYLQQKYSVYVDGKQYVLGASYRDAGAITGLGGVRFNDSGTGSMFVDNVYVGTTRFDYPRIQPDEGGIALNGYLPFEYLNATGPVLWEVFDERDAFDAVATPGSIASIDSTGIASAAGLGSFRLRAEDSIDRQDESGRITVSASQTLGNARLAANGTPSTIGSTVVTGVFDGHIYVEQEDRAAGIRVNTPQTAAVGQRVTASGVIQTSAGEKVLDSAWIAGGPVGDPLEWLILNNRHVTRMLSDVPAGLDPSGLLIQIYGTITRIEADRFYINDGASDGDGLVVLWPGFDAGQLGKFAMVGGPLGSYLEGAEYVPAIRLRQAGDIVIAN